VSKEKTILLELQYLPPVHYFAKLFTYDRVLLEAQENYTKGSYRNRCHIAGVNGLQALSVPLRKGKNNNTNIRQVHIAYDEAWAGRHWKSICSAYGNSPYFKFYKDELKHFFLNKRYEYLWDFSFELLHYFIRTIGIHIKVELTADFHRKVPAGIDDWRGKINPKKPISDPTFSPKYYPQVFEDRHGFMPNLSVVDLLLCNGRGARSVLRQSIVGFELPKRT
jgi:hypothetical protein